MRASGTHLPLSCEGEALLLLCNSKHNDNTLGLPGGNLDPGEELLQAAVREVEEEVCECGHSMRCQTAWVTRMHVFVMHAM